MYAQGSQVAVTDYRIRGANRLTLLARAGELLSSPAAGEHTLERLAALLVAGFADRCAIDVLEEDGSIARVAEVPRGDRASSPAGPHGAGVVMRTGEPELLQRDGTSYMCVPLMTREKPWGAITLTSSGRPFEHDDVEVASELARRAANAIENTRLVQSLASSEERYRLLFEASPLPMWVYDAASLRFLAVNDAAIRHYGYTRAEFLGMTIMDIRPREDVDRLIADLHRAGGPGSPLPGTWRHQRKDGAIIDVEITAGRVVMEGRRAALVLAHDVTERRRLEERLAQAEKMEAIGRLAGGVAHDFNNLLTVISGYTELLLARPETTGRDQLGEIAHAAEQAAALTRQLLAFSRRQVLHPTVLDLDAIVAGMEPMVRRIIGDDVNVGVRLAGDLPAIEADQAQLERVILNLAANARDAMPDGGRLTIETAAVELDDDYVASRGDGTPGPNVLLAVSDTGVGMSEDVRRHLFEPFFTTKAPGKGTGLGLSMVYGFIKQSGGYISAESKVGEGTTFKLYLRRAAAVGAKSVAPETHAAAPADNGKVILVVDDNPAVRATVLLQLKALGYSVYEADNAQSALSVLDDMEQIDLLFTDIVMPGPMNGKELAAKARGKRPDLKVLYTSGFPGSFGDDRVDDRDALLNKPYRRRDLANAIHRALQTGT